MSRDLTEMNKLEEYLKAKGIHYRREDEDDTLPEEMRKKWVGKYEPFDKHQIVVFNESGKRLWDVICNRGSYGCKEGLLEGMGDIFESEVEGFLTAADVIERIEGGRR